MPFFFKISPLLILLSSFSSAYGQHQVIAVLEAMRDKNYQYEIKGSFKVPVDGGALIDSLTITRNYVVAKVGKYASLYDYLNNPEELFLVSDGNVLATVSLHPRFSHSACHDRRVVQMFPFYLLDVFFQRETLSPDEMKFLGEDGSEYRIEVNEDTLVRWGGLEVVDFRFEQIDAFRDPDQLDINLDVERPCSDYFTNVRRLNTILEALKND